MGWLDTFFDRPKPTADEHPDGALDVVTFDRAGLLHASGPTGLFACIGRETLDRDWEPPPVPEARLSLLPPGDEEPAPVSAAVTWTTQFHDEVTVGDEIALSMVGHPDARAVIIEATAEGRPVVECSHCRASVTVEDFNLAMLIKRAKPSGVC